MARISNSIISAAAAAIIATVSLTTGSTSVSAGNWEGQGGYGRHGDRAGMAAAGFVGGMILLNVLNNHQRRTDWASSGYPDGSRSTSAGTRGGRFVVLHDREGNVVGREFVPRRMTQARRDAAQKRAARAVARQAKAAARAAARAARQARRQVARVAGNRNGTYAAGYNPDTNRTTVSSYDRNGRRVTRVVNGRLSQAQIRNVVRGN